MDSTGVISCKRGDQSQRRHIKHEPIFHVALQHALIRFLDLIDPDLLDFAGDSAFGTEIEHLLGLGDSADQGTLGEFNRREPTFAKATAWQAKKTERYDLFYSVVSVISCKG